MMSITGLISGSIKGKYAPVLFMLLCLFHIKFGIIPGWNKIVSDFPNYYVSAKLVAEGGEPMILYHDSLFNSESHVRNIYVPARFSPFPPHTAFMMIPLTPFAPLAAKRIWLGLNLVLITAIIIIGKKIISGSVYFSANLLLLSGFCLSNELMLGQVYLLMLLLTLAGYLLVMNNNPVLGSFLWGVVMSIKYFTMALIPVFLLSGRFRFVAGMTSGLLIVIIPGLWILGPEVYSVFTKQVFAQHLQGRIAGQATFSILFQSFESLFNNLFIKDSTWNPNPFYESTTLFVIFKICAGFIPVALVIHCLWHLRQSPCLSPLGGALMITLILLLEPSSATYHLLLLVFPLMLAWSVFQMPGYQQYAIWLTVTLFCIGFLSVVMNMLATRFEFPLVMQFNRLWFLILFFGILLKASYAVARRFPSIASRETGI